MAVAMLPFLIDAAAQRCRSQLGPDAFLNAGAAEWSARLRQDGTPRRESALRGLAKLGGTAPPVGGGSDATFLFVAQMMTVGLTAQIRPENCSQVDTIARAIAPLPTDNLAQLIVAGLDLGMSARSDDDDPDEADQDEDDDDASASEAGAGETPSSPPICRT